MAIYDWSRVSILDEEFFSRFFLFFNIGISLIMELSLWMLGTNNDYIYGFFKGTFTNVIPWHSPLRNFFPLFAATVFCSLLICGLFIAYQKIRHRNDVNPIILNGNGHFNNICLNSPLVTTFHTFLLLFVLACCISIIASFKYLLLGIQKSVIIGVTIHLFFHIIFPNILVSRKREFITFLIREIKDLFM